MPSSKRLLRPPRQGRRSCVRGAPADPDAGVLAMASGAAFAAVVVGQMANAFACRSARRTPWRLGWASNRLVVGAVVVELAALAVFLFVTPLASALGHAPPDPGPAAIAVLAVPAVFVADLAYKRIGRRMASAR